MPQSFLLQGWTHVEGTAGNGIIQGEEGRLDLSGFTDVVLYLSTKACGNRTAFDYQTAPSKDDDLFVSILPAPPGPVTPGPDGQDVQVIRFATATQPLARWLRWKLEDEDDYAATFRIWVSAASRGRAALRHAAASMSGRGRRQTPAGASLLSGPRRLRPATDIALPGRSR